MRTNTIRIQSAMKSSQIKPACQSQATLISASWKEIVFGISGVPEEDFAVADGEGDFGEGGDVLGGVGGEDDEVGVVVLGVDGVVEAANVGCGESLIETPGRALRPVA
jgi:hypothetical protein